MPTTLPQPRRSLERSFKQLRGLSFRRIDACAEVLRDWFSLKSAINRHALSVQLWRVHDWLISPLTLQALDYTGLARHIVSVLRKGRDLDADLILLLTIIEGPPEPKKIDLMRQHERAVAKGLYDGLTKEPRRYEELEIQTMSDPSLRQFWNRIKSRYSGQFRPNTRGVMRRTLSRERGFDCRREFSWSRKRDRFQITFDALCYRWCLYGFEKDDPLALKLTVNPTPHGTMIFVPKGMSLAANRTFVWKAITEIHKAHGASRQGEALFQIRLQHRADCKAAKKHDAEARALGYRGKRRTDYVLGKMGQLPNRVRWLKRLLHDS